MHELSICQSILNSIREEFEKLEPAPEKLLQARIVVGSMRQIVPEFMHEAYKAVTASSEFAGSELEIKVLPNIAVCKSCGWKGELEMKLFICGECSGTDVELESGMELYLDNMEVEYKNNS
ncbi:MAG: hydrogenase maturation nickel metallochaperone HypA/HybF [Planctomycetota bacterium]|jgi:hydrogenase nickel incorporation protein HypA/HybF